MPRRKHLPLSTLLVLAFISALFIGVLIEIRLPNVGIRAITMGT